MTLTRRKFVRLAATSATATAAVKLTGCTSSSSSSASSGNTGTLRVLSWPGYDETDVVGEFQDLHKVKVEFKTYLGGEQMLQFFSQVPRGTFDCIIADAEYIPKLSALNAIDTLNPTDYPEIKNYHASYQNFPFYYQNGKLVALAVRFGFDSLCYNKQHFSEDEVKSWNILFRNDLKGKVALFDWYLPDMGIASLANFPKRENPYEVTNEQLQQIRSWLLKLKPNVGLVTTNIQDLTNAFINGSVLAGPIGDWMILNAVVEGHDYLAAEVPQEGALRWTDSVTVCKESRNKDLALEWVKYLTLPKVQARVANVKALKSGAPNIQAISFMSDQEKQLLGYVPDPNQPNKLLVESRLDRSRQRTLPVNQPEKVWQDIYNEFKTS